MRRLSASFRRAYLLIETEESSNFVKSNFGYLDGTSGNKSRYELRRKLMQVLHRYPQIRLIWSTSFTQSCLFVKELKKNKGEPDLLKFAKSEEEEEEAQT